MAAETSLSIEYRHTNVIIGKLLTGVPSGEKLGRVDCIKHLDVFEMELSCNRYCKKPTEQCG